MSQSNHKKQLRYPITTMAVSHKKGALRVPIITPEIEEKLTPAEGKSYALLNEKLGPCVGNEEAVHVVHDAARGIPPGYESVPVYGRNSAPIDVDSYVCPDPNSGASLKQWLNPNNYAQLSDVEFLRSLLPTPAANPVRDTIDSDDPDAPDLLARPKGYYLKVSNTGKYHRATSFVIQWDGVRYRLTETCSGTHEERLILFSVRIHEFGKNVSFTIAYEELSEILEIIHKREGEAIVFCGAKSLSSALDIFLRQQLHYCHEIRELATRGWVVFPNGQSMYVHDRIPEVPGFCFRSGFCFCHGSAPASPAEMVQNAFHLLDLSDDAPAVVIPFLWAHLGLLWSLFDAAGCAPHVLLYITGTTGSMKTAVSKVLFNFSGDPKNVLPATFRDTSASMEISIERYKDSVLLVDDFCPGANRSSQAIMNQTLENLIRFYGDGNTKGRATPSMDIVNIKKARGLCVITGEDVAGSYSSLLRCLILRVSNTTYHGEVLKQFQDEPWRWIEWLQLFVDQLPQLIPDIVDRIGRSMPICRETASQYIRERRLIDTYSYLSITAHIVLEVASKCSECDYSALYAQQFDDLLLQTCVHSQESAKESNPVRLFTRALKALIDQGKCKIASRFEFEQDPKAYLGVCEGDFYYLWPQDTYRWVVSYYQSVGQVFSLSQKATWEALVDAGIMDVKISKTHGGISKEYSPKAPFSTRPRMIRLSLARLLEFESKA